MSSIISSIIVVTAGAILGVVLYTMLQPYLAYEQASWQAENDCISYNIMQNVPRSAIIRDHGTCFIKSSY